MIHNGYLYVLSNPAMSGILKIGVTERSGAHRARELYSGATGVPSPFRLEFEVTVRNASLRERHVHDALAIHRVNDSREFFRVDLATAVNAILDEVSACFERAEVDQTPVRNPEPPRRQKTPEEQERVRQYLAGLKSMLAVDAKEARA
jgi:hypothetical protein